MTCVSDSGRWVSWDQAAELAGVRVPTVEHAVRVGRIKRRPMRGARPSLDKASVLEWAVWYREVKAGQAQRRAARERARAASKSRGRARGQSPRVSTPEAVEAPEDETWLAVPEAALVLDCSESSVLRWADGGHLVVKVDGRAWLSGSSVARLAATRAGDAAAWVSQEEAAAIVGCSHARIPELVDEGLLVQRPGPRWQASISWESANAAAVVWSRRLREAAADRQARKAARPTNAAPDDGQEWVTTGNAAQMLGMTRNGVGERIRSGTLPAVLRGNRYWLRRMDVESAATGEAMYPCDQDRSL